MSTQIKNPNPKDLVGVRRAPLSGLSGDVLYLMGLAMLEGARKYGKHNWRAAPVVASVYYDAINRHLWDYWEGRTIDPDSGVHHLAKAMADMHILLDAELQGTLIDDRPIGAREGIDFIKLNAIASEIVDRVKDAKEPFLRSPIAKVERRNCIAANEKSAVT